MEFDAQILLKAVEAFRAHRAKNLDVRKDELIQVHARPEAALSETMEEIHLAAVITLKEARTIKDSWETLLTILIGIIGTTIADGVRIGIEYERLRRERVDTPVVR